MRPVLALAVAAALAACSGPSKARYTELLHQCRQANREKLRMLKEYDASTCDASSKWLDESNRLRGRADLDARRVAGGFGR